MRRVGGGGGGGGGGILMMTMKISSPVSFQRKYLSLKGATCHLLNYIIAFPWELNVPAATVRI